ncbi:MAG TPA: glycosyltransferase family 1 protein [Rhodocyclaceae bacterium]
MNIALISEHASPLATPGGVDCGGQNVYVAHVAAELARAGHRVDVFTRRDHPAQPEVVAAEPGLLPPRMRVIHVPAGPARFVPKEELLPLMPAFCEAIAGFVRKGAARLSCAGSGGTRLEAALPAIGPAYDVVHANFFMSGMAAQRLRDLHGIPFVITFHALGKVRRRFQGKADAFPPQRIAIEEQLVAGADRVIAECPCDRDDLVELYGAERERVEVVPCGFDPDELKPGDRSLRAELGLSDADFVVLQLGRLVPRKGIDNVVRAMAELKRRHGIAATLLIVGGESDRPDAALTPEIGRLALIAAEEGVSGQVRFAGRQPRHRLRDFYSAADVFVSTPWYEPFGITPLEAMACACPVVGAAVGGIQYSVVDGVTGFLVPPKDPIQLADRLARLQRDSELRRSFGQRGLRRVRRHFTWRLVAAELARVYRDVAAAPEHAVMERRAQA